MARLDQLLLAVCLAAAPVAAVRLLRLSDPAPAAADGHTRALQYILKDRQGVVVERPSVPWSSLEKRHQLEGIYRQNKQWYADSGSSRESQEAHGGFQEANTYLQPPEAGPRPYDSSHRAASDADHNADHHDTESIRFTGSYVARHPYFEESSRSFPAENPPSFRDTYVHNQVFPPIPTKSTIKKASSFAGFSPFLNRRPSPAAAASATITGATPVGEDRDEFLHHTSSYEDDPRPYHVTTTYQEPATYHEPTSYQEEDGGLLGKFKKYGGAMAPLLLATGLLFLFPSVQTITSTSSRRRRRRRRRRRDLNASGEDAAEKTLLLVERLQTIYSIDEDSLCPSRLFCQLGDVIADSASPARVIKYMDQFYRHGDVNMKIMRKAAYAEDSKCHLYDCDAEKDAVAAAGSREYE